MLVDYCRLEACPQELEAVCKKKTKEHGDSEKYFFYKFSNLNYLTKILIASLCLYASRYI